MAVNGIIEIHKAEVENLLQTTEGVEAGGAKKAALPAPGAESLTAVIGAPGVARVAIAAYTAKHEASAKVKIKHGLGTEIVHVSAYTASSKLPSEKIIDAAAATGGIAKVKIESPNEILVTLGSGEPAAKEEFFYIVTG